MLCPFYNGIHEETVPGRKKRGGGEDVDGRNKFLKIYR